VSLRESLRSIFACLVLEAGVLLGAPMRPDQIKELMRQMNQPTIAHVLPDEPASGDGPEEPPPI
jgi:hypothetical protein